MSCRNLTTGVLLECRFGCCSVRNGDNRCCEDRDFSLFGMVAAGAFVFCICLCIFCVCYRKWLSHKKSTTDTDETPVLNAAASRTTESRNNHVTSNADIANDAPPTYSANDAPPTYSAIFGHQDSLQIVANQSQLEAQQNTANNTLTMNSTNTQAESIGNTRNNDSQMVRCSGNTRFSDSVEPPDYASYMQEHGTS